MGGEGEVDVVVVGAGLAGLFAARNLTKRAPDLKVVVLEANDRVGGRTYTTTLKTVAAEKENFDLGGQWVGPTQLRVLALIKELGIEIYEQFTTGTKLLQLGSTQLRSYDDALPSMSDLLQYSPLEALDLIRFMATVQLNESKVNLESPFDDPRAIEWDSTTVGQFFNARCWTSTLRDFADIVCRSVFGTTADRMSMLYFLGYGHAGGSMVTVLEAVGDGAQRYKIKGGSQQLSKRMAADLKVSLNRVVTHINQDSASVTVTHTDPTGLAQANLVKYVITYPKAFWKDRGLSGEIVASGYTHTPGELRPLSLCFDSTSPSGSPALVGFYNSEWSEKPFLERRAALLEDLNKFFGPVASDYIDFADKDWASEPFAGGCPVGILPPGYMEAMMRIRVPINRLHFAGTESATVWTGYMDGALQSGLRAAAEVLIELRPNLPRSQDELSGSVYAAGYKVPTPKNFAYPKTSLFSVRNVFLLTAIVAAAAFAARRYRP